jgi:hypothetical protein
MKRMFGTNNEGADPQIDELLQHPSQQAARNLVRSIPDETVSMAWRSQLNERLMQQAPAKPVRRSWLWKPALALGVAGALAMGVLLRAPVPNTSPNEPQDFAHTFVATHAQTLSYTEVAGAGLPPHEAVPVSYADDDWDEVFDWHYEL